MSIGAWITLSVALIGFFGTIISAIIKTPRKSSEPETKKENGNGKTVTDHTRCPAHSGIVANIESLHENIRQVVRKQDEMWNGIDEIRTDVKTIMRQNGDGR